MNKYMTIDDNGYIAFWKSDEVEKTSMYGWEPNRERWVHERWDILIDDYPKGECPYTISSALLKKANKQPVKIKIVVEEIT